MHAQPTRILMIFKGILRLALGGVPRKCATNVVQAKHVFRMLMASHVLYVVLRKGLYSASMVRMCLFFYETLLSKIYPHFIYKTFLETA